MQIRPIATDCSAQTVYNNRAQQKSPTFGMLKIVPKQVKSVAELFGYPPLQRALKARNTLEALRNYKEFIDGRFFKSDLILAETPRIYIKSTDEIINASSGVWTSDGKIMLRCDGTSPINQTPTTAKLVLPANGRSLEDIKMEIATQYGSNSRAQILAGTEKAMEAIEDGAVVNYDPPILEPPVFAKAEIPTPKQARLYQGICDIFGV